MFSTDPGSIFEVTAQGRLTKFATLADVIMGKKFPNSALAEGLDGNYYGSSMGNLYGTTQKVEPMAMGPF